MATCRDCGKVLGLFGSSSETLCENCALIQEAEQMFHRIKALEDEGLSHEEIAKAVWERPEDGDKGAA
ncbi:hypothetical protein SAMN05444722_0888 [Rhodovulum sp. ES.010]|uniref:hypothetical protein n=1 Tax=Rhodovulum sp. ES.010 TaxID=1882821 RepID=UPI000929C233|nr:hypothetical protein [Rhodovulum sp. ES.010]SIO22197.1 hypothetical protein SAMN05444722_0888 [Rhodovulum sp. ES.010]